MKVLVVGKGGREHTLAWKIAQSPRVKKIYAAPGSPGMAQHAECVDILVDASISDMEKMQAEIDRLRDFALQQQIDLTVVGPEDVLSAGIVDRFAEKGLKVFGPTAAAARIESDKVFSKNLMADIGVPSALHRTFTNSAEAICYVEEQGAPIVVKASGLAAGKGAIVAQTEEEAIQALRSILDERIFGNAGNEVVIEEFMEGEEASFFAITDGRDYVTLVSSQDHKAIYDGDKGPNTGGMGAYSPAPVLTPELIRQSEDRIIRPVLDEMQRRSCPFQGVLYCGLMIDVKGPRVVEFNCRFGDPEAQVILPMLETDLVDLIEAACDGRLNEIEIKNTDGAAVCVVMASGGYPGPYETGKEIGGLEQFAGRQDLVVFHAGTARHEDRLVTTGGRVLGVTAVAGDIAAAVEKAYKAADQISFEKAYFRRDIAHRALARQQ